MARDGRRLLTGSWDKTARLWDVATGQEVRTLTGHRDSVWGVALSADGRQALEELPPPGEAGSLERALGQARDLGDLDETLEAARARLARAEQELSWRLGRQ